jgi:hypothetical protein
LAAASEPFGLNVRKAAYFDIGEDRVTCMEHGKIFSPLFVWTPVNRTRCRYGYLIALMSHMKRDLTLLVTGILAAVLFLSITGAFLLYVPALAQ